MSLGITEFDRPEDGAWDTRNPSLFYFVTTGGAIKAGRKMPDPKEAAKMLDEEVVQSARLYKLTFSDISAPERGGMTALVNDSAMVQGRDGQMESARSYDNITVDMDGNILVQEDPGCTPYRARTWRFRPDGSAEQLLAADPNPFLEGRPGYLTQDEENSGIIDVTRLFEGVAGYDSSSRRYYLADMQVHAKAASAADVEPGQLYLISVPR